MARNGVLCLALFLTALALLAPGCRGERTGTGKSVANQPASAAEMKQRFQAAKAKYGEQAPLPAKSSSSQ